MEAAGASILFLPPYSPEFNPIELCWNKVKHVLRSLAARCRHSLDAAVAHAVDLVSPEDARNWFNHCGYGRLWGQAIGSP
ncbi:MAG: transposase [Deltaproteobacteria bacterium]|nr:transposase [Deltaproteobacteria bacterium]